MPGPTCEGLGAGINPSQPLGRAKIRYLQDTAVGVDENIIALQFGNTSGESCTNSRTLTRCLEIPESDKQQVATRQNRVISASAANDACTMVLKQVEA